MHARWRGRYGFRACWCRGFFPGALSAVGILLADVVRDYSRTVMLGGRCDCWQRWRGFCERAGVGASENLRPKVLKGTAQRTLDLRYRRQGYELNVEYDPQAPARSI